MENDRPIKLNFSVNAVDSDRDQAQEQGNCSEDQAQVSMLIVNQGFGKNAHENCQHDEACNYVPSVALVL